MELRVTFADGRSKLWRWHPNARVEKVFEARKAGEVTSCRYVDKLFYTPPQCWFITDALARAAFEKKLRNDFEIAYSAELTKKTASQVALEELDMQMQDSARELALIRQTYADAGGTLDAIETARLAALEAAELKRYQDLRAKFIRALPD
jgi:hypothetical protein